MASFADIVPTNYVYLITPDADSNLTAVGELFMAINAVEHRVFLPSVAT